MNQSVHLARTNPAMFRSVRSAHHRSLHDLPKELTPIPEEKWPQAWEGPSQKIIAAWHSRTFLVQIFDQGGSVRLSVNRTHLDHSGHWKDGITWDELMEIKGQVGYAADWAVEIFPPVEHLVDVANIRHLFLIDPPPFGWVRKPPVVHGETCEKVEHGPDDWLHDEDDDTPYSVGGFRFCGRCHERLNADQQGGTAA